MFADRVKETSTTTGTGTLTLAGAVSGFDLFQAAFSASDKLYYVIDNGSQWEVGIGTLATTTTLSRDKVIASSNSDALVSLTSGTKYVFCTWPAEEALSSRDTKRHALLATTANITLSGEQAIDGTTTSTSRVLVKDQSTAAQNGIYVSASGAWARSDDYATGTDGTCAIVSVRQGTVNGRKLFYSASGGAVVVGTNDPVWKELVSTVDVNGNDQIKFVTTASAVNNVEFTNAATGGGPKISVAGSDTNIQLDVEAKGTSVVVTKASAGTWSTASDGATVTFNLSLGNFQKVTLGGNRTLAISNSVDGQPFVLKLIQDGTGSRTVTWFSNIKWDGASAPTLTTTASRFDTLGFIKDGSDYIGYVLGLNHN